MSPNSNVSVVIPCFNHGPFVEQAIESGLAQTYRDYQIIVVDDGSTHEETKEHLAAIKAPHTRVIRSDDNRGLSAARNLGIRHTSGAYICALDADDWLEPTWFEHGVRLLEHDRELRSEERRVGKGWM